MYSKLALEGELKKLRGHYTQVNDERNQLKRTVDEKDKELQELVDQKTKLVQEHSDTMELIRNDLQQYVKDYEEERATRVKFAQEIDHLKGKLIEYGGGNPDVSRELSECLISALKLFQTNF